MELRKLFGPRHTFGATVDQLVADLVSGTVIVRDAGAGPAIVPDQQVASKSLTPSVGGRTHTPPKAPPGTAIAR